MKNSIFNSNRVRPMYIMYNEFFTCEERLQFWGFTFLPNYLGIDLGKRRKHFSVACIFMIIVFALASLSFFISGYYLLHGDKSFTITMLENFAAAGSMSAILLKVFWLLFYHRERLIKVVANIEEHFPHSGIDQINLKTAKHLQLIKFFHKAHSWLFLWVFFIYCSMPFLYKFYGWFSSIEVPWEPIFTILLPFNQQNMFVFLPINLILIWIVFVGLYVVNATDLLFACIVNVLAMEFDNLAKIITEIDWDDDKIVKAQEEEEAIKKLKILVKAHSKLCDIALELQVIFSFLMFINVFASISVLCSYAFLTVSGVSFYLLAKFFSPLSAVMLQIFIQCYFGDRLAESSTAVADGVYNSAWYKASPKFRKMALMIMMRAQIVQNIRAWKIADVNLNTFNWIIATAHSYYSFLTGVFEH